jgi:DNA repair protein RadC
VLRDLPLSDRPRERLAKNGPSTLSDTDLLAIVVGSGTRTLDAAMVAGALLGRFPDLRRMAVAGIAELGEVAGVGRATASRVKAALALAGRLAERPFERGERIDGPRAIYERVGRRLAQLEREQFLGLALDSAHRVLTELRFADGGGCAVAFKPRDVFANLLREGAASVVFVHNHPSGDPEPSLDDRRLTQRLRRAGVLIGLTVLDHVVVARGGYRSILGGEVGG